jgi:hypothetical protein
MRKLVTSANIQIVVGLMLFIYFVAQSYSFLNSRFIQIAKPFSENKNVYDFVYAALRELWLVMLIWSIMFFMILIFKIIELKKHDG